MSTIGFIGIGNMGLPMSANLVKAGHTVRAFDIVPKHMTQAEEAGCVAAGSIAEACAGAETVISILPEGEHVRDVYLSDGGVLDSAEAGALLIDMSTIDLASVREVQGAANARGFEMLDAPVSRGTKGAREGTLVIIAGATEEGFARAKPYFDILGTDIFHTGEPGAGCATKICNNMMMGINFICASEGLMLAKHIGLDVEKFFEIVSKSSGANWPLVGYGMLPGMVEGSPAENNYEPGFTATMMRKDLRLSQQAAQMAGASTPLGAQAHAIFSLYCKSGYSELDVSSIVRFIGGELTE
tara:strand:- start:10651 stop:11547 length:897 start_codon:yes stop_codon:yes gene_type:complete